MPDSPAAAQALPLLYTNPVALRPDLHAGLGVPDLATASYAARATAVPLNLVEFAAAAAHYPIVFLAGPQPVAVAVLGVRTDENLFVSAAGGWRAQTYVPAYVRRYPFILAEDKAADTLTLCIDDAPGNLVPLKEGGRQLFDGTKPAKLASDALDFCRAYHGDAAATELFVRALSDAGLLVPRGASIELKTGERFAIEGMLGIDEPKLRELPTTTVADWFRRGWLDMAILALSSTRNWAALVELLAERR
jgi:hypothetical protein